MNKITVGKLNYNKTLLKCNFNIQTLRSKHQQNNWINCQKADHEKTNCQCHLGC